jgi:outer membrane protein OmpA-like peptidoglycan-associated protein
MPTNIYDGVKLNRLCFRLSRGASSGSYISNLRITDAAPDMRSKLLTDGKLVSYGIYFDVNKDVVKSESYGTIKEISTILSENPNLKIKIVGHTDSDGDDKSNLDLSKRRAASVKNALVKDFGIDATRIETDGKGEGEPVAPNDSAVNKALNRRVEFIKI